VSGWVEGENGAKKRKVKNWNKNINWKDEEERGQ